MSTSVHAALNHIKQAVLGDVDMVVTNDQWDAAFQGTWAPVSRAVDQPVRIPIQQAIREARP